jgi:hypothetical protein
MVPAPKGRDNGIRRMVTQKGLEGNAEINYLETNSPVVAAVPGEGSSA